MVKKMVDKKNYLNYGINYVNKLSKKHLLIFVALGLIATTLMTPMAATGTTTPTDTTTMEIEDNAYEIQSELLEDTMTPTDTTTMKGTTTTWIISVTDSSRVTNPSNAESAPDGAYANFGGNTAGSQLVGKMGATPPSGAKIAIYASTSTSVGVSFEIYMSPTGTGSWTYVGSGTVTGGSNWYTASGSAPGSNQYIGVYSIGSDKLNIDSVRATY